MIKKIFNAFDFGIKPESNDCVFEVLQALEACRESAGATLIFPQGTYHFRPGRAREFYGAISNNGHGVRRCGIPLENITDLTIDGQGSTFIFHDMMVGLMIIRSSSIIVKNISIDWAIPFYSQGEVLHADHQSFTVKIEKEYPFVIRNERFFLKGEHWEFPLKNFLEYDAMTRTPAFGVFDNGGSGWNQTEIKAVELSPGVVRVEIAMPNPPKIGNVLILRCGHRHSPAVFLDDSKNIILENVNVHHAGGMGFIVQHCRDVALLKCKVIPPPQSDRIFSAAGDATHFVSCQGLIRLENCAFESQLDDPFNVHGIYLRLEKLLDSKTVLAKRVHGEQTGVSPGSKGEIFRFTNAKTLLGVEERELFSFQDINPEYLILKFTKDCPNFLIGDVLENINRSPDLMIRGCHARRNRARGFLISTAGKVLIEDNVVSTAGSAIKISGDANSWYESGAVKDVLIRKNHFIDCKYGGGWGKAVIDIDPEIKNLGVKEFHQNIRIEENKFSTFNAPLLYARSVKGLSFKNNVIEKTNTYPTNPLLVHAIQIEHSSQIEISGNSGIAGDVVCQEKNLGPLINLKVSR